MKTEAGDPLVFDLKSRIAPIRFEDIFLTSIQPLNIGWELLKFFRKFPGVENLHSRVCTRPERQSPSARWKDSLRPWPSS